MQMRNWLPRSGRLPNCGTSSGSNLYRIRGNVTGTPCLAKAQQGRYVSMAICTLESEVSRKCRAWSLELISASWGQNTPLSGLT